MVLNLWLTRLLLLEMAVAMLLAKLMLHCVGRYVAVEMSMVILADTKAIRQLHRVDINSRVVHGSKVLGSKVRGRYVVGVDGQVVRLLLLGMRHDVDLAGLLFGILL